MSTTDESCRSEEVTSDTTGTISMHMGTKTDVVRRPRGLLTDDVECVLMNGHVAPPDMKLSVFLKRIGLDIVPNRDGSMRTVVLSPGEYIPNERERRFVLNADEYRMYELRYVVVPFLRTKEVNSLQQWKERRGDLNCCGHEDVRDEAWRVAVGKLNNAVTAFGMMGDAEYHSQFVLPMAPAAGTTGDWGNNCSWLVWLVRHFPGTMTIIYCAVLMACVVLVSLVLWIR
ncbi:hypothetical protein ERJ75_001516800 [Trypanosoma vivax]|nr:hypothetical protein ERJ75_001516800 [Trypanosoma vivax]